MNKATAMLAMDINFKVTIVSLVCTFSIRPFAIVPVSVLQGRDVFIIQVVPDTRLGTG
jgi:hypothetical protein